MANTKTIEDVDIFGRRNLKGSPFYYTGDRALQNAITMFVTSQKGDYLENPLLGGYLLQLQFKSLNLNVRQLQFELLQALQQRFSGAASFDFVRFSPDAANRRWILDVYFKSLYSQKSQQLTIETTLEIQKIKQESPIIEYTEVEYEGDNLIEFVESKLEELADETLIFHDKLQQWVWGQYVFPNLEATDSEFPTVLGLING